MIRLNVPGGAQLLHGRNVSDEVDLPVSTFEDHLRLSAQVIVHMRQDAAFQ
ncbi:MAG: hypothetical protein R2729_19700 [Bryobacteraceae bacterium]